MSAIMVIAIYKNTQCEKTLDEREVRACVLCMRACVRARCAYLGE